MGKGFTLLEIMVVTIIMSTFLYIVVPSSAIYRKSLDIGVKAELESLRSSIRIYFINNDGTYPEKLSDLVPAHLNRLPNGWNGTLGKGDFLYDAEKGIVSLAPDISGSQNDPKGRPYRDY